MFDWLKLNKNVYTKPQRFVDIKRSSVIVNFINEGHPLYDNIVAKEKNDYRILAPNNSAFDENSLINTFVAIVTYNEQNYLVINSLKHFKEQSIGGVLQFDENIYNVIPFFENDEEYQTASDYVYSETYEYDHPVETYALICKSAKNSARLVVNRGKTPIFVNMIDESREMFTSKLKGDDIEMIDYVVIPAILEYKKLRDDASKVS